MKIEPHTYWRGPMNDDRMMNNSGSAVVGMPRDSGSRQTVDDHAEYAYTISFLYKIIQLARNDTLKRAGEKK